MIASSFSPTVTGGRPPTRPRRLAAASPRGHALLDQGPLVLRQRAEHVKQQFARCLGSVHPFGERPERDLLVLQRIHDGEQV